MLVVDLNVQKYILLRIAVIESNISMSNYSYGTLNTSPEYNCCLGIGFR